MRIKSGFINIKDPCYQPGTWCAIENEKARNGDWSMDASVQDFEQWGNRVTALEVKHTDLKGPRLNWIKFGEIGVDSGQAGIFDSDVNTHEDDMYKVICKTTWDESNPRADPFGEIDRGVCASSGFGDGSYPVYIIKDNDEIIGVRIVFIDDDQAEDHSQD